jgi:hypothetical protein
MKSWDDYIEALGRLDRADSLRARIKIMNLFGTEAQLLKMGVPYPHTYPEWLRVDKSAGTV